MSEGGTASAFFDAPDPFLEGRFFTLHRGLGIVGEIDVERFLKIRYVAFVKKHAREMWAAHLIAPVDFRVLKRDGDTKLL